MKQQAGEEARQHQRDHQAGDQAGRGQTRAVSHDFSKDPARHCAERHANADFAGSLRHIVAEHGVNPDRGEDHRQCGKRSEQQHDEAAAAQRFIQRGSQRFDPEQGESRIFFRDGRTYRARDRDRIRRTHQQRLGRCRRLRERRIGGGWRHFGEPMKALVADDPDDEMRSPPEGNLLAYGRAPWKEARGRCFVDQRHQARLRRIAVGEETALDERHLQRPEVAGADPTQGNLGPVARLRFPADHGEGVREAGIQRVLCRQRYTFHAWEARPPSAGARR